jgi:serine O-acetyltransferase
MSDRVLTLAEIIATDFGKAGDSRVTPYLRLVRRALFAGSPAAFPAWVRLAELARAHRWSRMAAWMRRHMESRYGCYVHPKAQIGSGLQTPHPVGIVVGAGCLIGSGVILYQNVTLGTNEQAKYLAGVPSYPTIGDGAILYAGAVVIGAIQIGERVVVGANAVVTTDMPDGCIAVGVPAVPKQPRSAFLAAGLALNSQVAPHMPFAAGSSCPK